jgi:hypothetical protein
MPISPSDTPLQYQYKPLNLMAFAEPLAKMQEKYDLTKAVIEDSDVKATALQWAQDPEKAKALEEIYRNKRDEIAQNLAESKNYTQAGTQIKKLQRLWNEDPERLALESNYKLWEERNKAEIERVGKPESQGGITKQQYLQWVADEKRKFESEEVGGTNFRQDAVNPTGTYNPVTTKVGRETDRQKEFDDLKYKVAGDIKAKKWSGALSSMGIDPTSQDAKYVQSEFEKLSPQEIDQKVEQYIRGLDRFKPWLNEVADYNLKDYRYANDEGASYQKLASELITKNYNANEAYIKSLEKAKKTDTDDYKNAIKNKEFLREQMDNPDDKVIKDLFTRDALNKQYDAAALGDIFAINNSSTSYTFRDIPKEDGGGGAGDPFGKNAVGSFDPNGALPVIGNLTQQKVKAGQALYPSLKLFNNIAGGAARTFVLGEQGSADRKRLEASPGEQRERQMKLFNIAVAAKDAKDFYTKAKAAGFNSGVTMANATTVFNALKVPDAQQYVNKIFTNSGNDFNKYSDAKNQLEVIDNNINSSPEFKKSVEVVAAQKVNVTTSDVEKLAQRWNTTVDKLVKSGVVQVRSGGPTKYEQGVAVQGSDYVMSANNLAKAYGFKSLQDGLEHKMDVAGINKELDGIIATQKQKAINQGGQVMSHRYAGDKAVDEGLTARFNSVGDLTSFMPANGKAWGNTPGFDEKGNLAAGTSFDFEGKQSVKLVVNGNQVFYEVPIKYKNADGDMTKSTILVKPKVGTEEFQEQLLTFIKNKSAATRFDNSLSAETYDMSQRALYDLTTRSTLTPIKANSFRVNAGEPPIVLETVPSGYAGTSLEIVKAYDRATGTNVYKVRANSPTGSQFLAAENGKEFTSTDVNAAKVLISQQINGK